MGLYLFIFAVKNSVLPFDILINAYGILRLFS